MMEVKELKKGIECDNCKAVTTIFKNAEASKFNCVFCKKNKWNVLWNEHGDNEEKEVREIYARSYDKIVELIGVYMDMSEEHKKLVALWILGTYTHECHNTFPFLFINAMRGSGKTRLLKIISALSKGSNNEIHAGLSESVFFRTPPHTTMVLDEVESIGSKDKQTLREYLNASYKMGGVVSRNKRVRTKEGGENYEIEKFHPYKPLAMANINGLEEVLADRCVSFVLNKSNNPGKTKLIEDFESNLDFKNIKRTLREIQCSLCSVVMAQNTGTSWNNYIRDKYNYTKLHTTLPTLTTLTTPKISLKEEEFYNKIDNSGIDGRNLELFFPLFIVAKLISDDTFDGILEIGKNFTFIRKNDEMTESRDVCVYEYISLKNSKVFEFISISELTKGFKEYVGESEEDDKWINTRWFGRALKRLDLVSEKKRVARGTQVSLKVEKAREQLKLFKGEEHPSSEVKNGK